MNFVDFFKTMHRFCDGSEKKCRECPLKNYPCQCSLDEVAREAQEITLCEIDKIVTRWAKEHPIKTRQSEFLKQFPNADLTRLLPCHIEKDKRPMRCAEYAYLSASCRCYRCRDDYWNTEVSE